MRKKIKNNISYEKRVLETLYRVNRFISEIHDLHRLLHLIMKESTKVMNTESSSLMLFDETTNELYFEIALGEKSGKIKNLRLSMGEGIAGLAAKKRKTIVVEDTSKDKRFSIKMDSISGYKTKNLLATPLIRNNRLIGVLEVINKKFSVTQTYSSDDIKILEFFSDQAAIAIENAQLIKSNVSKERLAAMGQAIAGISHYIKNILTTGKGSTSLIDTAIENHNPEMLQKAWPILKRSNETIWNLVMDMLSYSKERKPELSPANINQIVKGVIETIQPDENRKDIKIIQNLDLQMPDILLDKSRIQDALLNLLGNAIDALKEKQDALIHLSTVYHPKDKIIEFIIEDNGSGIPEHIQSKIFEPFFSTKGNKGTGLGLAVTRKIIEEHNGSIQCQSTVGQGTIFKLELPVLK